MHKCVNKTHQPTDKTPGRNELFLKARQEISKGVPRFYLNNGRKITCRSCAALPMPSEFIDKVNHMGTAEGPPSLITF